MKNFATIIIILISFSCASGALAANPFITPKKDLPEIAVAPIPASGPMQMIMHWQNNLRKQMADLAQKIKSDPNDSSFWLLMLLSFVYGAIHSLGPGHGKILAVSYFMNRSGPARQGVLFGQIAMFVHVFSAVCLVLGAKYILEKPMSMTVDQYGPRLELISYVMLMVLGLFLLFRTVRELRNNSSVTPHEELEPSRKGIIPLALATGIVPCPAAILILVFSISLGITVTGLFAVLFVSLGMGVIISSVSVLAILSKRGASGILAADNIWSRRIYSCLCMAGALTLFSFGGVLFLGRLGPLFS